MNNALRLLNGLAIAILLAISLQSNAADGQETAFRAGWWLGLALCALASTPALFALGSAATLRLRRNAATARIELYDRILELPAEERHLVLRGVFEEDAA